LSLTVWGHEGCSLPLALRRSYSTGLPAQYKPPGLRGEATPTGPSLFLPNFRRTYRLLVRGAPHRRKTPRVASRWRFYPGMQARGPSAGSSYDKQGPVRSIRLDHHGYSLGRFPRSEVFEWPWVASSDASRGATAWDYYEQTQQKRARWTSAPRHSTTEGHAVHA